jgi:hypothetical protein
MRVYSVSHSDAVQHHIAGTDSSYCGCQRGVIALFFGAVQLDLNDREKSGGKLLVT